MLVEQKDHIRQPVNHSNKDGTDVYEQTDREHRKERKKRRENKEMNCLLSHCAVSLHKLENS